MEAPYPAISIMHWQSSLASPTYCICSMAFTIGIEETATQAEEGGIASIRPDSKLQKGRHTMTPHPAAWRHALIASAALALTACGGGDDETPTPPPPPQPTTLEMVQKYVQATQDLTAKQLPSTGAERFALLDACYLGQGNTKASLIAGWDATTQAFSAHLVSRTITNVEIVNERKTTNADGSSRHEVDIRFDEKYTDNTTATGQTETLVAGSTSGTCATPQNSADLRALGDQRVVSVRLVSRNTSIVFHKFSDGSPTGYAQVRREARFRVNDPANKATYAVASWTGASGFRSIKLLSPRIARDAPEMLGKRGNATYVDTDTFRICPSDSGFTIANAATADCTQFGVRGDSLSNWVNTPYTTEKLADADKSFTSWAPGTSTEVTFQIYADDGWKTVNGQQGKTPIATYKTTLRNNSYALADMANAPAAYPVLTGSSLTYAEIVAATKGTGGSTNLTWTAAKPPVGGLPFAASDAYSYRSGPSATGSGGFPTIRALISVPLVSGATSVAQPIGGKPDGASATNYAEWGLTYVDRNGRQMFLNAQFN